MEAREAREKTTILFNLCSYSRFDLAAYGQYLAGNLQDLEHPEAKIEEAVARIPV